MEKRNTLKNQPMVKKDLFKNLKIKICEHITVPTATAITSLKSTLPTIRRTCFACKRRKLFVKKRGVPISPTLIAHSREDFCNKCFKNLKTQVATNFKYE